MRALIQRVNQASVSVNDKVCGRIGKGLLIFLGIHKSDTPTQSNNLAKMISTFRIFPDAEGKMNLDIQQADAQILVVSQFTLYGTLVKGRRPEFTQAALPEPAFLLYETFINDLKTRTKRDVETGTFGALMEVDLTNDGPVTFLLETSD